MAITAWFYDGSSAVRREVEMQVVGRDFYLAETERRHGPYRFADLNYSGEQGRSFVYKHDEIDGWRMGMEGDVPVELRRLLPERGKYGGWVDKIGLGPASLVFAGISAAALAVILWSPQWLAPLVPQSAEKRLGDALVGDFGGRFCDTKAGRAALAKMSRGLDEDISDLDIQVANVNMVNAVALPGGKIILFQGLLNGAKSADEVAGVLAHEMGHVRERHVMQSLIRQMGLSVVMGGLDGNVGGALNGLLSMGYSRGAETEADEHAIKALASAEISPIATAGFFDRLSRMEPGSKGEAGKGETGKDTAKDPAETNAAKDDKNANNPEVLLGYLSSHPLSKNRKEAFEKSRIKGKSYKPVLNQSEWNDLKTMCSKDPDVESGFGFDFGE